ncbi:MAG: tRNA (adenosine(37)-N6)-threonylcarbamoyltransferase complex transferase subunit TsaD [Ardenticatenales bacterium]
MSAHGRLILGIETSCDETAAAVVEAGRIVWSNVVASQAALHAPFGGVFPEVASRQHVRDIGGVIEAALQTAGVTLAGVDAIAVTAGPGLSGALMVGVNAAKGLALASGKPLIAVNHLSGHLASHWLHTDGRLNMRDAFTDPDGIAPPPLPHLGLIVSGGHTDLFWVRALDDVVPLAATRDDAAGEAFDKAARLLGLGYPGGPAIQRAAEGGDPTRFPLPVARTDDGDWSFSGVKSALARQVARLTSAPTHPLPIADLAASFQSAIVRALTDRLALAALAARDHPPRAIAVSGGVSANAALRAALTALGRELGIPVLCPPLALCTDNAAMIAAAGWFRWAGGGGTAGVGGVGEGLGLEVEADWRLV